MKSELSYQMGLKREPDNNRNVPGSSLPHTLPPKGRYKIHVTYNQTLFFTPFNKKQRMKFLRGSNKGSNRNQTVFPLCYGIYRYNQFLHFTGGHGCTYTQSLNQINKHIHKQIMAILHKDTRVPIMVHLQSRTCRSRKRTDPSQFRLAPYLQLHVSKQQIHEELITHRICVG